MHYFHNANWGKWLAFIFATIIEVLLGVNVYFLVDISTQAVFPGLPALSAIVGALFGLGIFLGGMWVFMYAEYSFQAAHTYSRHKQTWPWREIVVFALVLGVIGLDLTSLAFRREYLAARGADWLLVFFIILALLPPMIGVIIHVMVNKPAKAKYVEAYERIQGSAIADLEAEMPKMSLDRKLRFLQGDSAALEEHLSDNRTKVQEIEVARVTEKARSVEEQEQMAGPLARLFTPKQEQGNGHRK